MDDFDLEVAPLEPPNSEQVEQSAEPAHVSSATPVPVHFKSHLSPGTRVVRLGGIVGVLLLAVAVVVAVTPGARSVIIGVVLGPTPTVPLTPTPLVSGFDRIAVEDQVPWGTLLVDGEPAPLPGPASPATQ